MSLGDLWDAAVGTCVNKDGVIDEDRKEKLIRAREVYMMNRNPEVSLKVELASILDLYQDGWYSYGKIHHILSCDEELMDYMIRQEEAERMFEEEYDPDDYDYEDYDYDFSYETNEDICGNGTDEVEPVEMCESKVNEDLEQYYKDTNADVDTHNLFMDPTGYYLNKADDFTKPVDNFYDDKVKHIRSEILLPGEAYSKKDLENLRRSINHSRFLKKFDEIVNNPDFDKSKLMCESSAMLIYHLLVFPFLEMDNYHFETWAMES